MTRSRSQRFAKRHHGAIRHNDRRMNKIARFTTISVFGVVATKMVDGQLNTDADVCDPGCTPMYQVAINGSTYITDGDRWFGFQYSHGARRVLVEDVHSKTILQHSYRGVIKAAIKGYLDGKSRSFKFNGRRLSIDEDHILGPSERLHDLFGVNNVEIDDD